MKVWIGKAYINAKLSGIAGASFYDRIIQILQTSVGKEVGIDFNFAGITRTALIFIDRPAQALIKSAPDTITAMSVKQELFEAYFLNGQDIGDDAILSDIATRHELSYPSEQAFHTAVEQDLMEANRLNIQGVPFIIVEKEWAISGAHAPESFQPLFDAALAKKNASATTS